MVDMTATTKTPARQELTYIGQTITCPAGQVIVALTWIRHSAYRVTINTRGIGGLGREIEGASYTDEHTARAEARRMVHAYAKGASPAQLAARRNDLLDLAEANRKRWAPEAQRRADRYQDMADAIQPLQGRATEEALAASVADTMAAAFEAALIAA